MICATTQLQDLNYSYLSLIKRIADTCPEEADALGLSADDIKFLVTLSAGEVEMLASQLISLGLIDLSDAQLNIPMNKFRGFSRNFGDKTDCGDI